MNLYTIGFTKKSAEEFFESIKNAHISLLVDVRLNNNSQLSGFAKGRDLAYFLPRLAACKYVHGLRFAPTKELLSNYRKGVVPWGGTRSPIANCVRKEIWRITSGVCSSKRM